MRWLRSHRFDARALPLVNGHYNRQTPTSRQFMPPGRCVVLLTADATAVWGVSWPRFVQHAWPGAWVNTLFRNEAGRRDLSSELIVEAVAATRAMLGEPPPEGLITFVDPAAVGAKRDPGRCYLRAGFSLVGRTAKRGRLVFALTPAAMPPPAPPLAGWTAQLALPFPVGREWVPVN